MPWQPDGTFEREVSLSPSRTGDDVWDQDQSGSVKVIAVRHDNHDQDLAKGIQESLNVNGLNAMLDNLNMNNFQFVGLRDAVALAEAVTLRQLQNAIGVTGTGNIITVDNLKVRGQTRQKNNVSATATINVDVSAANRHEIDNNSGGSDTTVNFTNLPTGADATLGEEYEIEGRIHFWNGATPGTIVITGLTGARTIGEPTYIANGVSILNYMIRRRAGDTLRTTLVWTAQQT